MASDDREEPRFGAVRSPAALAESSWAQARTLADAGRLKLNWDSLLDIAPLPLPAGIDLADKVEGMLLGPAVGDALGNTSESMNPADRHARHGWISGYLPNRYADHRAVGLASDDTQMAFWAIEQMLADGGLDPVSLGRAFCSRQIYGIGQSVRRFQRNRQAGGPWFAWGEPSAGTAP